MTFSELPLHPDIQERLKKQGFESPTPIQGKAIPYILDNTDVVGLAQTGTGKTLAFLIPVIQKLTEQYEKNPPGDEKRPIACVIMAPTRELCTQIREEAEKIKGPNIRVTEIMGGTGYQRQEDALREGTDIVVATPGRLIDFLKQEKIDLSNTRYLVLDEADRMFDMGFMNDMLTIIIRTPRDRQTLMFSATMSFEINRIITDYMRDPIEIQVTPDKITTDNIEQKLYHLGRREKIPYLLNTLLNEETDLVLIFTNMRVYVDEIVNKLQKYGIKARGLSSLLPQHKRTKLMKDYKEGRVKVLVATDVASRGIDVDGISHVFNFDLPQDTENYVHRIGRTARAGRSGVSISYCSEMDYESLAKIEDMLGHKLEVSDVNPDFCEFPKGEFEDLRPAGSRGQDRASRGGDRRDDRRGDRGRRSGGRSGGRSEGGRDSRKGPRDRGPEKSRPRRGGGERPPKERQETSRAGSRPEKGGRDKDKRPPKNKAPRGERREKTPDTDKPPVNRENMKRVTVVGGDKPKTGLWGKVKKLFGKS